jgi:hypothetical protein
MQRKQCWGLENELLQNPDKGDLMRGTGGFRKIRMKLREEEKAQALGGYAEMNARRMGESGRLGPPELKVS